MPVAHVFAEGRDIDGREASGECGIAGCQGRRKILMFFDRKNWFDSLLTHFSRHEGVILGVQDFDTLTERVFGSFRDGVGIPYFFCEI